MKNILITTIIAAASFTLSHAEQGGKKGPRKPPPHVIEQFDTDGDGTLNETEREAAKQARELKMEERKAFRDSFDIDGSGDLNETEKEAFKAAVEEKVIARFDEDGDGVLNETEKLNAEQARKKHCKKGGDCKKGKKKGGEQQF